MKRLLIFLPTIGYGGAEMSLTRIAGYLSEHKRINIHLVVAKKLDKNDEIKISNIISAVDEEVKMLNCKKESKKGCNNKSTKCITHNLWDQLDQHINNFFEKVKLQDLVRKNQTLNK